MGSDMKVTRYRRENEVSYTLGATLTIELLKIRPDLVVKILVSSSLQKNSAAEYLYQLCRESQIEIEQNDKAFHILSPKGNCYVIGIFRKYEAPLLPGSHIVLVNPSDAGNLGTIIRTAVGLGLARIAIIRPGVDIFDPKTVRASMGALFHSRFQYYESLEAYRRQFPQQHLYSFMLRRSTPIHNITYEKPYSLLFGNEATGLPDDYADFTRAVLIPHSGAIDSLNLPIAAGIAMFTASSQAGDAVGRE